MKYVILNLKMNGSREVISQYSIFLRPAKENVKVIIAPPSAYLHHARKSFKYDVSIAAQDVCEAESGEYTGQNSASILKDLASEYVIIGHSEARKYLMQNDASIQKKVNIAIKTGLKVILCVGESLEDRKSGKYFDKISQQLSVLANDIKSEDLMIAYEPIWAIGSGLSAKLEDISQMSCFIKEYCKKRNIVNFNILYGGSVNLNNGKDIINMENINGVLVGKMSLKVNDVNEFLNIL